MGMPRPRPNFVSKEDRFVVDVEECEVNGGYVGTTD